MITRKQYIRVRDNTNGVIINIIDDIEEYTRNYTIEDKDRFYELGQEVKISVVTKIEPANVSTRDYKPLYDR